MDQEDRDNIIAGLAGRAAVEKLGRKAGEAAMKEYMKEYEKQKEKYSKMSEKELRDLHAKWLNEMWF